METVFFILTILQSTRLTKSFYPLIVYCLFAGLSNKEMGANSEQAKIVWLCVFRPKLTDNCMDSFQHAVLNLKPLHLSSLHESFSWYLENFLGCKQGQPRSVLYEQVIMSSGAVCSPEAGSWPSLSALGRRSRSTSLVVSQRLPAGLSSSCHSGGR